ncbi:uncharacterized protein [Apostichopus japonicus]|uniref:uncharacterized protein isoform X3 n=1 Tax=Stichopus japonicus TaxID=307972 RepID=UPI003AB4C614
MLRAAMETRGRIPINQWEKVMGPMWLSYTTGAPILSKRVTKCISSCWLNTGLKSHISTTLLRNTIVSKSKTPTYGPGPSGVKFPRAGTMTNTDQDTDKQSTTTTTGGTESSRMWTGIRHRTEKTPEDETVWTDNVETVLRLVFCNVFASKTTPTTRQVNETLDGHATTKFVFLKKSTVEGIRQNLVYRINKLK